MGDKKPRRPSSGRANGKKWISIRRLILPEAGEPYNNLQKTELDLVLIRKEQLWKIKDCKAIPGEHTTTQHKPVVFVVRKNRTKPNTIVGRKTIKWWKCIDGVFTAYRDRVKVKYEELGEEVDDVEEEWKKYKYAFVGNAEGLCGRSMGMGEKTRNNQEWWTTEVASAIREKKEVWKVIENMKVNGKSAGRRDVAYIWTEEIKQPRKLWTRPGMIWKQICTLN